MLGNVSLQEEDFVRKICTDIDNYVSEPCINKVFVFPPLSSRLRFIIHRIVQEEYEHEKLTTFSIGNEEKRRTVICHFGNLKRPVFTKLNHRMPEDGRVQDETKCSDQLQTSTVSSGHCRARRPDMQLYVPRAQRNKGSQRPASVPHEDMAESGIRCSAIEKPAPKKDTVRQTKFKFKAGINKSVTVKTKKVSHKTASLPHESDVVVPLEDLKTDNCGIPDPELDATLLHSIASPSAESDERSAVCEDCELNYRPTNEYEVSETGDAKMRHEDDKIQHDVETKDYEILKNKISVQKLHRESVCEDYTHVVQDDGDGSRCHISDVEDGISPCTYDSETVTCKESANLTIGNADLANIEATSKVVTAGTGCCGISSVINNDNDYAAEGNLKCKNTKKELVVEDTVCNKTKSDDDKSWDSLFDDSGDCLDPDLMEELTEAVCSVNIQKPQLDYFAFKVKDPEISDEEFGHIVEIYGFSSQFKTEDLISALSPFRNSGYNIKWVDETHALGVFPSQFVASDVLATDHPLIKTRPLSQAIKASKMKAKHCAEFLLPYKQRPETSSTLARRLVTGALGISANVSRQQREVERRKLQDARARKKLATKQREAAWDGTLGDCALDGSTSNEK